MSRVFTRDAAPAAHDHLDDVLVEISALALLNGENEDLRDARMEENVPPGGADYLRRSAADHLRYCTECQARVAARQSAVIELRAGAVAVGDEAAEAVDLDEQRRAILSRLNPRHGNGRVLTFPVRETNTSRRSRPAMRWLAAAAAAGLFAGLGLGSAIGPLATRSTTIRVHRLASPRTAIATSGVSVQPAYMADEHFLAELETALDDRRVSELWALDHLTPRTGDGSRATARRSPAGAR